MKPMTPVRKRPFFAKADKDAGPVGPHSAKPDCVAALLLSCAKELLEGGSGSASHATRQNRLDMAERCLDRAEERLLAGKMTRGAVRSPPLESPSPMGRGSDTDFVADEMIKGYGHGACAAAAKRVTDHILAGEREGTELWRKIVLAIRDRAT